MTQSGVWVRFGSKLSLGSSGGNCEPSTVLEKPIQTIHWWAFIQEATKRRDKKESSGGGIGDSWKSDYLSSWLSHMCKGVRGCVRVGMCVDRVLVFVCVVKSSSIKN